MWDDRYAEPGFAFGDAPNDFLAAEAHRIPAGGRVLCLGEGEGRNAVWLAQRGHAVTAVDRARVGLRKAQALATSRGVTITTVAADLARFAIAADAWHGIVSIWLHVPADLRARVHAACVRALRPGGVLLLEAYTPRQVGLGTGGPSDVALCPTLGDLRRELAGLALDVAEVKTRDVQEGRLHRGPSEVVQVVARRA